MLFKDEKILFFLTYKKKVPEEGIEQELIVTE